VYDPLDLGLERCAQHMLCPASIRIEKNAFVVWHPEAEYTPRVDNIAAPLNGAVNDRRIQQVTLNNFDLRITMQPRILLRVAREDADRVITRPTQRGNKVAAKKTGAASYKDHRGIPPVVNTTLLG
jgi:hypothetical protein